MASEEIGCTTAHKVIRTVQRFPGEDDGTRGMRFSCKGRGLYLIQKKKKKRSSWL